MNISPYVSFSHFGQYWTSQIDHPPPFILLPFWAAAPKVAMPYTTGEILSVRPSVRSVRPARLLGSLTKLLGPPARLLGLKPGFWGFQPGFWGLQPGFWGFLPGFWVLRLGSWVFQPRLGPLALGHLGSLPLHSPGTRAHSPSTPPALGLTPPPLHQLSGASSLASGAFS